MSDHKRYDVQEIIDNHGHEWMAEQIVKLRRKLDEQVIATAYIQDDLEQLKRERYELIIKLSYAIELLIEAGLYDDEKETHYYLDESLRKEHISEATRKEIEGDE